MDDGRVSCHVMHVDDDAAVHHVCPRVSCASVALGSYHRSSHRRDTSWYGKDAHRCDVARVRRRATSSVAVATDRIFESGEG